MKYLLNLLTQEEKERILEMHTGKKPTVNEQGVFSGVKQGVAGLKAKVGTGLQNVKGSFSKTQGQSAQKSAGLEQDLAQVKSRSTDLINTIKPLSVEIQEKIIKLTENNNAYGQGFSAVQLEFLAKLTTLNKALQYVTGQLETFNSYVPNYVAMQQQSQAQPVAQAQPQAQPQSQAQPESQAQTIGK